MGNSPLAPPTVLPRHGTTYILVAYGEHEGVARLEHLYGFPVRDVDQALPVHLD